VLGELTPSSRNEPEDPPVTESSIIAAIRSTSFSGPIPPPEMLKGHNEVLPGAADRILKMAENQNKHRIAMEASVAASDMKRAGHGLLAGLLVTSLLILCATWCILSGHDAAGGTLGTATIIGLAGVFVYGTITRKDERRKRAGGNKPEQKIPTGS
jgi:uncharacterized membrane protein